MPETVTVLLAAPASLVVKAKVPPLRLSVPNRVPAVTTAVPAAVVSPLYVLTTLLVLAVRLAAVTLTVDPVVVRLL
jgi:hypothetical protein